MHCAPAARRCVRPYHAALHAALSHDRRDDGSDAIRGFSSRGPRRRGNAVPGSSVQHFIRATNHPLRFELDNRLLVLLPAPINGNYIFHSPRFPRYNRRVIKGFGMSKSTISTYQLFEMVADAEAGRLWLESRLWPNGPRCPVCGLGDRITARKGGYYRCRQCKEDFTVRTGTVMERSHIPLHKWVYTMYLLVTARKGIITPPTILPTPTSLGAGR